MDEVLLPEDLRETTVASGQLAVQLGSQAFSISITLSLLWEMQTPQQEE